MRLVIILSIILFSCSNNSREEDGKEQQKENNKDIVDKPTSADIEGCYWQVLKRDTLVAWLVQKGDSISGKLSFDNFEKDGSSGFVRGSLDGDIIKLWYSFQSEGMNSVMEVWYKKQGDALLRGIGAPGVKADTSYFTDHSEIQFDPRQRLQKVACSEIPAKYK